MTSKRIVFMTTSFSYTLVSLYLDNPGIGDFSWEKILDNTPSRTWENNNSIHFRKDDLKSNVAEIIREANDQGIRIVRKGQRYEIQNIKEVVDRMHHTDIVHFHDPTKRTEYREAWSGSGVVGEKTKR